MGYGFQEDKGWSRLNSTLYAGHHAEAEEAMGFCYFNTVAITAKQILHFTGMYHQIICKL